MTDSPPQLDASADLPTVLAAWHDATCKLQSTHEVLQAEVARLSDELAIKNQELKREHRLADLGRMAAHVAHEVRNSLVPVSLYMSLLRRRLSDDSGSIDILTKIEAGFTTLEATVSDLLSFTAHRQPQWQSFLLAELLEDLSSGLGPQMEAQGIDLDVDVPPNMVVSADREMLRRALLNLMLNAVDAMPDGGELVVTAIGGVGAIEIEVADSGNGLADEHSREVFEPFFSTKSGGTGLGLSVVCHIAQAHGGSISATNCHEGGAAFTIRIPQRAMGVAA